jgi:hypothetical protein
VTWPGGLGAFAGLSSRGVLVVQAEIARDRRKDVWLSLRGTPFDVSLRVALESSSGVDGLFLEVARLNVNRVLAGSAATRRIAVVTGRGTVPGAGNESDRTYQRTEWVLAPAGDAPDSRATSMDERLGGYPHRPGPSEAVALAVAGRASQDAAVIEVTPEGIVWHRGVRSDGTDVSPPIRFPFPSPK